jgi:malonate decarboxylase gamma subunit
MTLAELLKLLFRSSEIDTTTAGLICGIGLLPDGMKVHVLGVVESAELGIDAAAALARRVLSIARIPDAAPILMLVDSGSQRMSKRDELLGLNEYLAHLIKALRLADLAGHRTIGLLYGGSAAGAFLATGLAAGTLVAMPGAHPKVMDLATMARVTKLPLESLTEKAQSTAIFAPGLANMIKVGAVAEQWDAKNSLAAQLSEMLSKTPAISDGRDRLGELRHGRNRAALIAERVAALAGSDG